MIIKHILKNVQWFSLHFRTRHNIINVDFLVSLHNFDLFLFVVYHFLFNLMCTDRLVIQTSLFQSIAKYLDGDAKII